MLKWCFSKLQFFFDDCIIVYSMQLVPFISSNCFKPSHLICHLQETSIKLVHVIITLEVVSCEFFGATICNHFQAFKSLTLMSNVYMSIFKERLWFLFLAICFCYWRMKISCCLYCNLCFWKKLEATIWNWMLFIFIFNSNHVIEFLIFK
jgi:hypothetical protein